MINNVMTVINISIILFVIIAGSFYIKFDNYSPFNPFGVQGVMHGAGTVFFSYIGTMHDSHSLCNCIYVFLYTGSFPVKTSNHLKQGLIALQLLREKSPTRLVICQ